VCIGAGADCEMGGCTIRPCVEEQSTACDPDQLIAVCLFFCPLST
jgi:hypothetical protein